LKLIGRLVGNSLPQSTAWVKRRTDLLKLRDLILVINAMQKICWPQKIIVACVLFVDIISSFKCKMYVEREDSLIGLCTLMRKQ
jgi:hypothetical protein